MQPAGDTCNREEEIARRMVGLGVTEEDLEETFVRSGGHGGQNVNKVATCVVLLHKPSGVQVKCQSSRHQGQNRWLARRILLDKIQSARERAAAAARQAAEKARRRNRPPSRRAKLRMLEQKSRRAERKSLRRAPAD
jgi:protein subunit release factor B